MEEVIKAYDKIKKVIQSCTTLEHIDTVNKLLILFENKYFLIKKGDISYYTILRNRLLLRKRCIVLNIDLI